MSSLKGSLYLLQSRYHGLYRNRPKFAVLNPVARYPEGLAWQFNVPKKVLRKSPEFKKFHSFLVFETEVVGIDCYL